MEGWILRACNLMERLDINFDLSECLHGVDVEAQVGSEYGVELGRDGSSVSADISCTTAEDVIREEDEDIPELTSATTSDEECESEQDFNFKGGLSGGKVLDFTKDIKFKVKSNEDPEQFDGLISCKEAQEQHELDRILYEEWGQDIPSKEDRWSSDSEAGEKEVEDIKLEDIDSYERDRTMASVDTSGGVDGDSKV